MERLEDQTDAQLEGDVCLPTPLTNDENKARQTAILTDTKKYFFIDSLDKLQKHWDAQRTSYNYWYMHTILDTSNKIRVVVLQGCRKEPKPNPESIALIDVRILGRDAFTTTGKKSTSLSLKMILESFEHKIFVFWQKSTALQLFHEYGIKMQAVSSIQLLCNAVEIATRGDDIEEVASLKCIIECFTYRQQFMREMVTELECVMAHNHEVAALASLPNVITRPLTAYCLSFIKILRKLNELLFGEVSSSILHALLQANKMNYDSPPESRDEYRDGATTESPFRLDSFERMEPQTWEQADEAKEADEVDEADDAQYVHAPDEQSGEMNSAKDQDSNASEEPADGTKKKRRRRRRRKNKSANAAEVSNPMHYSDYNHDHQNGYSQTGGYPNGGWNSGYNQGYNQGPVPPPPYINNNGWQYPMPPPGPSFYSGYHALPMFPLPPMHPGPPFYARPDPPPTPPMYYGPMGQLTMPPQIGPNFNAHYGPYMNQPGYNMQLNNPPLPREGVHGQRSLAHQPTTSNRVEAEAAKEAGAEARTNAGAAEGFEEVVNSGATSTLRYSNGIDFIPAAQRSPAKRSPKDKKDNKGDEHSYDISPSYINKSVPRSGVSCAGEAGQADAATESNEECEQPRPQQAERPDLVIERCIDDTRQMDSVAKEFEAVVNA